MGREERATLLHEPEMEERMRRVRTLLATRFDYLPQVRAAQTAAVDGPGASRLRPCDTCKQTGFVARGGWLLRCGDCGGSGSRRAGKTDEPWDAYTELPLEEARTPRTISGGFSLREDIARIDRELRKLRADEHARAGIVADNEPWVVKFDQMEKTGSYRELRVQLQRLDRVCPRLRWSLKVVYESSVSIVSRDAERLEPLAIGWLSLKMRGPIYLPPQYEQAAAAERNRGVADLLRLGWKPGRVARTLGISHKTVQRVSRALKEAA